MKKKFLISQILWVLGNAAPSSQNDVNSIISAQNNSLKAVKNGDEDDVSSDYDLSESSDKMSVDDSAVGASRIIFFDKIW